MIGLDLSSALFVFKTQAQFLNLKKTDVSLFQTSSP